MTGTGDSGKSLAAKLGLKPGTTLLAVDAPAHYPTLIGGVDGVRITYVTPADLPAPVHDLVHLFCRDTATLGAHAKGALACIAAGGSLWVSWPKKGSPLHVDLTEDGVREALLRLGWVDVKVCAVDGDWSALKFVKRRG